MANSLTKINSAGIKDDSIVNADVNSAAAIASTKVAFTTTETNGVATTLQESLERVFVFEDFGAKGDWNGSSGTDDTTAITNCLARAKASNNAFAYGSPGKQYRITSTLALNGNQIDGRDCTFIKDHAGVGIKVTGGSTFSDLKNFKLEPSSGNTASDWTLTDGTEIQDGSFVANETYIIDTVGSTDFTAIGAAANTVGEIFTATGTGGSDDGGDARQLSTFKHGIWVEGTRVRAHNVIVTNHKGCGIYIRDNASGHNCNRSRYTDIICNGNSIAGLFLDGSTAVDDDMAAVIIRGQFNSNKGYAIYAPQLSPIRAADIWIQQAEGNFTGSSWPANFKDESHADCKYAVTFHKARNCTIGGYVEQATGFELKLGDNTSMCNVHSQRENQDKDTGTSDDNVWRSGNRLHTPEQDTVITTKTKKLAITTAALGISETSPDTMLHVTSSAKEVATFESTLNANISNEIVFTGNRGHANAADNDITTSFTFNGSTDSAAATYAQLKVHATDVSNGNKESKITLHARGSNNMIEALTVDKGGINVTGSINISAVPTSDPGVAGELWRDGTDLKISTG